MNMINIFPQIKQLYKKYVQDMAEELNKILSYFKFKKKRTNL